MCSQCTDIDESHAMHCTQTLALFVVKICNAENEVSLLDTQTLLQRNVLIKILAKLTRFAFDVERTSLVD